MRAARIKAGRMSAGAILLALAACPAAADVTHEPGGSVLCDYRPLAWWDAQPSVLDAPGPLSPTHPSLFDFPGGVRAPLWVGGGAEGRGGPGRADSTAAPWPAAPESPAHSIVAPVPVPAIGGTLAVLLCGWLLGRWRR